MKGIITQKARFKMALEYSYYWCVRTESILANTTDKHYHFGLAGQVENWVNSNYILN